MAVAINDRTAEFRHIVSAAKRRQTQKPGSQRLLNDSQKDSGNGPPRRSEFARQAAEIGRGISATMGKLEKLAQRKRLWLYGYDGWNAEISQWPRRRRSLTTGRWRSTRYDDASAIRHRQMRRAARMGAVVDVREVMLTWEQLTFVIKQDLSALNEQIRSLQVLSKRLHPKPDQEGENNKNILLLLQGKLGDVSANFKVRCAHLCRSSSGGF